jgi:8-oxo-dGTP diphosphatase
MSENVVRVGVGVLVISPDGKILLGKRKGKLGENTYSLPGGHLEFGETPEGCARRELKEETDLDAKEVEVISLSNDIAYDRHYLTVGTLVKKYEGAARVMEADKFESWDWYGPEDLPQPLFSASKRLMENYSSGNFYNP